MLSIKSLNFLLLVASAGRVNGAYAGFANLKTLFTFGDSYTATSFSVTGAQPSVANPLGNPRNLGHTTANGENWIQYITVKYNQSLLFTYNFAVGGATVSADLVNSSVDVTTQVNDRFMPNYSGAKQTWNPATSLFGFWIGINDIGGTYTSGNSTDLHPSIFNKYRTLLDKLYNAGARNFLFLSVPPLERMPRTTQSNGAAEKIPLEKAAVDDWNGRLKVLTRDLRNKYTGTTVFLHDTYGLFSQVIDTPKQYPETSIYKDTTSYCVAYKKGTPEPDTKWDNCTYAVNEYMWKDGLHPTYPVHALLAKNVAKFVE